MLSRKIICWLEVKTTLITHAHVTNIVAWYSYINHIHSVCARSAIRRQKYNIGWKKVYFFAVFLCLPASPRPITMVLASHSTSTFRPIVFLDVAMSGSGRIDRSIEHGGASVARMKFPQYGANRVHSLGFDPLRSIEPEMFHIGGGHRTNFGS